jgi:hypothetical protein
LLLFLEDVQVANIEMAVVVYKVVSKAFNSIGMPVSYYKT